METEHVMLCACGDDRPLEQMYLRVETGFRVLRDGRDLWVTRYVVECIDCTISQGVDVDGLATMTNAFEASRCV